MFCAAMFVPRNEEEVKMPFKTTKRVEFRDTDMAGICHFASFFGYMEEAEHALLRELKIELFLKDGDDILSWPRVSAHCDYRSPARFGEVLDVEVTVQKLSDKTATYAFTFTHAQRLVAEGHVIAVCCRVAPGEPPIGISIPDQMRARLESMLS